jgi:Flp pilus assembly protein TadG
MMQCNRVRRRRGIVLPLVAICLVGLMGFLALAIDIGVMAMARNQAQNAADGAALAGARTLNGLSSQNFNVTAATAMANTVATSNAILGANITSAQVTTCQAGIYEYNSGAGRFQAVFGTTPTGTQTYGCMQVVVTTQQPTFFAKILGVTSLTVGASATAIHKPNDISLVLDFSGSMGYASQINYETSGSTCQSLNPDPNFPQFGPYSVFAGSGMILNYNSPPTAPGNYNTYVPPNPLQRVFPFVDTSPGYTYSPCNLTMTTTSGPPIVNNFLLSDQVTNAFVSSNTFPTTWTNVNTVPSGNPTYVITPAPSTFVTDYSSGFIGDPFPLANGITPTVGTVYTPNQYAQCVADIVGITRGNVTNSTICPLWCANGYDYVYAKNTLGTVAGVTGSANPNGKFQGFTMGPGYWGKTFYMWPPDPRTPAGTMGSAGYVAGDWRQRFFTAVGANSMQDNSMFWNSSGKWYTGTAADGTNYVPNYAAILAWLKNGPQTLPPSLCSGRVVYYNSIPTTIPLSGSNLGGGATSDQCFWKDYIDYVLGVGNWSNNSSLYGSQTANSNTGGGATLNYNNPSSTALTPQITAKSSLTATTYSITGATKATPIVITTGAQAVPLVTGNTVTISGVGGNTAANGTFAITVLSSTTFSLNGSAGNGTYTAATGTASLAPYMKYTDTPIHPRLQFWFGPLSMLGYMCDFSAGQKWNWRPGTSYEAQSWQLKVGIQAALSDIQANHPNDLASLIYYSNSVGYSTGRETMGLNFADMKNCLFFPYTLIGSLSNPAATFTPFSVSAGGPVDTGDTVIPVAGTSTCCMMGLWTAFNEFGNATNSTTGEVYKGRQTASKIVIFETDGIPNCACNGSLQGSGAAGNYYWGGITSGGSASYSTNLSFTPKNNACWAVQQICASTSATPPGYSTARNPAYVHAIAFGDMFESTSTSPYVVPALQFLTAVQCYGNTSTWPGGAVTPPGTMASWYTNSLDQVGLYTSPQPFKIITGTYTQRIANIGTCIQTIMQSGVQVALIQ